MTTKRDELAHKYCDHDINRDKASFRLGWDACEQHMRENPSEEFLALFEALEFECGNRCAVGINPCNAREALEAWRKRGEK
jgi:hypothetical protein